MKKTLLLLVLALTVLAFGVTAFAADSGAVDENEKSLTISVDVPEDYEITIPTDVTLKFGAESTALGSVSASSVRLAPNAAVVVTMNASCVLTTEDGLGSIPYSICADGEEIDAEKYQMTFFEDGESDALSVAITKEAWDNAAAGSYSDTITFGISVEDFAFVQ